MNSILRWTRRLIRPPSPPRVVPTSGFTALDKNKKLEEEAYPWYSPEAFYPVRIGEVFNSRYQTIGKLGYGSYSTVWLCRDLEAHKYVALKVYERNSSQGRREMQVYNHLNKIWTRHIGAKLIRTSKDAFDIGVSDNDWHQCIVHSPMAMNMMDFRELLGGRIPKSIFKMSFIHILLALDFLHTEAKLVHTDLTEGNILLSIEDQSILTKFENDEMENPSARKIDGDRVIYTSRSFEKPKDYGRPTIVDFGEARFGADSYKGLIQPFIYRAPEVVLDMQWTEKVDIWNAAMLAWELFEDQHMFDGRDATKKESNIHLLAEMVALLGPPPIDFVRQSPTHSQYFDEHGTLKLEIPTSSLESSEQLLTGEDKEGFLTFIRKMMRWVPEERLTAKELLKDPWLSSYEDDDDDETS